jgi:deoxyadenosine/deoxycytidine kinase
MEGQGFHALLHAVPAFTGHSGEDPIRWTLRIERIAVPLQCSDDAKLAVALSRLEGQAYDWSEACTFHTWADFKNALYTRYNEEPRIVKNKLYKCRQAAGENVMAYVDRFRVLAMRARVNDLEELVDRFLSGLIPSIYDRVIVSCPPTFELAVEKAVYFEKKLLLTKGRLGPDEYEQARGGRGGSNTPQRAPREGGNYAQWGQGRAPTPTREAPESRGVDNLRQGFENMKLNTRSHYGPEKVCFKCQQPGHIAAFCPNERPGGMGSMGTVLRPQRVMTRTSLNYPTMVSFRPGGSSEESDMSDMSDSDSPVVPRSRNTDPVTFAPSQGSGGQNESNLYISFPTTPVPVQWDAPQNIITTGRPIEAAPSMDPAKENGECTHPTPAISMRSTRMTGYPHVMERMDIDGSEPVPRPRVRSPFTPNPSSGHQVRPDSLGVPPGGPKVIRKIPGMEPGREKRVTFADEPQGSEPRAPREFKLGRNELRTLEELFHAIKVRSMGIEDLCNVRMNDVLMALSHKIQEFVVGPTPMATHKIHVSEVLHSAVRTKPLTVAANTGALFYDVLQAQMSVHGHPVEVIVDTGATSSAIGFEFAQKIGMLEEIEESEVTYVNADGVPCVSHGVLRRVPVSVGGLCLYVDALVIKGTHYSFLVGIDFLAPARAMINFTDHMLEFAVDKNLRGRVPLTCTTQRPRVQIPIHTLCAHALTSYGSGASFEDNIMFDVPVGTDTDKGDSEEPRFSPTPSDQSRGRSVRRLRTEGSSGEVQREPRLVPEEAKMPEYSPVTPTFLNPTLVSLDDCDDWDGRAVCDQGFDRRPSIDGTDGTVLGEAVFQLKCGLVNINKDLGVDERQAVYDVIAEFEDVFSSNPNDIGLNESVQHEIDTGDHHPIRQQPYRLSFAEREIVQKEIEKMLAADVIEPSRSPWASPIVLVPKKLTEDGRQTWRFAINYCALNQCTLKRDSYPTGDMNSIIDELANGTVFTCMDIRSSYWNISVHPNSREKTAFTSTYGLYQFKRLPYGLMNAPATMVRLVDTVFRPLLWKCVQIFVDDIVVYSPSVEQHVIDLKSVFALLRESRFKIALDKSKFAMDQIVYLGHQITGHNHTISPDPEKVECVKHYPTPVAVKQVRAFLGLASFFRRYIRSFSTIAEPLTRLLRKTVPFEWGPEQQVAFDTLKQCLTSSPILKQPNPKSGGWILYTDWSSVAIGAILAQQDGDNTHVISYGSRRLSKHERNYAPSEGEALAVVYFVEYYRPYLYDQEFTVYTDNAALQFMQNPKQLGGRLARWALRLSEYKFKIVYRAGAKQGHVDALTRQYSDCPAPKINCLIIPNPVPDDMQLPTHLERQVLNQMSVDLGKMEQAYAQRMAQAQQQTKEQPKQKLDTVEQAYQLPAYLVKLEEKLDEINKEEDQRQEQFHVRLAELCKEPAKQQLVKLGEELVKDQQKLDKLGEELVKGRQELAEVDQSLDRMEQFLGVNKVGPAISKPWALVRDSQVMGNALLGVSSDYASLDDLLLAGLSAPPKYQSTLTSAITNSFDDSQRQGYLDVHPTGQYMFLDMSRRCIIVRNLLRRDPKLGGSNDPRRHRMTMQAVIRSFSDNAELAASVIAVIPMREDSVSSHFKVHFRTTQDAEHFYAVVGPQLPRMQPATACVQPPSAIVYWTVQEQQNQARLAALMAWLSEHLPTSHPVWWHGMIMLSIHDVNPEHVIIITAADADCPTTSPFTAPPDSVASGYQASEPTTTVQVPAASEDLLPVKPISYTAMVQESCGAAAAMAQANVGEFVRMPPIPVINTLMSAQPVLGAQTCIIAVSGGIGSGKSTTLSRARPELEKLGFAVHLEPLMDYAPEVVERFYRDPVQYAWDIQVAALTAYRELPRAPLIVVERSPRESVSVFAQNLVNKGLLTEAQFAELNALKLECQFTPDAYVHVDTDPTTCMQRIALRGRGGEDLIEEQLLQEHAHLYDSMFDQTSEPVFYLDGHQTIQNLSDQLVSVARYLTLAPFTVRAAPVPVLAMRDGPAKRVRPAQTEPAEREVIDLCSDEEDDEPATKKRAVSERRQRVSHRGSARPSRAGPAVQGLQGMVGLHFRGGQGLPLPQEETQRSIPEFFSQIPAPATASASVPLATAPMPVPPATASAPGQQQTAGREGKQRRTEYVSLAETTTTDSTWGTTDTSSDGGISSDVDDAPVQILNNADVVDSLACSKCRGKDDEANLLVCDVCNKATHRTCLVRPLHSVPTGAWACEACTKKGEKGVLDITDDADVLEYLRSGNMPSKVGIDKRQRRALCKRVSKRA